MQQRCPLYVFLYSYDTDGTIQIEEHYFKCYIAIFDCRYRTFAGTLGLLECWISLQKDFKR